MDMLLRGQVQLGGMAAAALLAISTAIPMGILAAQGAAPQSQPVDEARPQAPVETAQGPALVPGTGWDGPTPEPAAIGPAGARGVDAQAIARFDVVPYQTFDGLFSIGVVAFHMNGIDRVEFSVDNGPWLAVRSMLYNPRTKVWEYWVNLDAGAFQKDGKVEVRAIAYPKVGIPRVLQPSSGHALDLYANGRRSLPNTGVVYHVTPSTGDDEKGTGTAAKPFQTLGHALTYLAAQQKVREGATIYLHEGIYSWPGNIEGDGAPNRWLTIASAPGVERSQVVFSGAGPGVLIRRLHLQNLTISHVREIEAPFKRRSGPYGNRFWVDGCELAGQVSEDGKVSGEEFVSGTAYYTDCLTHDHKNAVGGPLVRNLEAYNLRGDFLGSPTLLINCSVRHMRPAKGVHPDVFQVFKSKTDNTIIYGLKALDVVSQGINIGQASPQTDNIAIVNCLIEQVPGSVLRNFLPAAAAKGGSAKHVVLWHHTVLNQLTTDSYCGQRDLDIAGCVFDSFQSRADGDRTGWQVRHSHLGRGREVEGIDLTSGDPGWVRKAQYEGRTQVAPGDYRPAANSPLNGRVTELLVPIDVDGHVRRLPTAAGALAGVVEMQAQP